VIKNKNLITVSNKKSI